MKAADSLFTSRRAFPLVSLAPMTHPRIARKKNHNHDTTMQDNAKAALEEP
jgi:hypothetical protein